MLSFIAIGAAFVLTVIFAPKVTALKLRKKADTVSPFSSTSPLELEIEEEMIALEKKRKQKEEQAQKVPVSTEPLSLPPVQPTLALSLPDEPEIEKQLVPNANQTKELDAGTSLGNVLALSAPQNKKAKKKQKAL